jgi:hypothetical protein
MNELVSFLASRNGRTARGIAGIALIVIGLLLGGTAGWIVLIIGLVPLAAGLFDFCLVAALLGKPLKGADLRASLRRPTRKAR